MQHKTTNERSFFRLLPLAGILLGLSPGRVPAETVFVEAETFRSSSVGWAVTHNDQTQRASRTRTLWVRRRRPDRAVESHLGAARHIGLELKTAGEVRRVESVRVGPVAFESHETGTIRFAVPLEASDFILVSTK